MDQGYREILPIIRLRSESPPWLDTIVLLLLAALVLIPLLSYLFGKIRSRRQTLATFMDNAAECGLSEKQSQLLLHIARQDRMKQPLLLLSSLKSFDRHVGRHAARLNQQKNAAAKKTIEEISLIRQALHFDNTPLGQPMQTTRELEPGQTLMVWPVKGGPKGFSQCVIVHRDDHAITAVPLIREDESHLCALQAGDKIKVRFWRAEDTEYRFRTEILETVAAVTSITIKHAEHLERVQKRDFFRLHTNFDLALYRNGETIEESLVEEDRELPAPIRVRVVDISGGGLAVLSREELPEDTTLKVDPDCAHTFPLANMHCLVIKQSRDNKGGYRANLEFIDPPTKQQNEIVRRIYQQQIRNAAG